MIIARKRNSTSCRDYDTAKELDDAKSRYFDPRTKRHRINTWDWLGTGRESASTGR